MTKMPAALKAKQAWSIEDLLDLDYFLGLDAEADPDSLLQRDKSIAEKTILPALGLAELPVDAGRELRAAGIWQWLQHRRQTLALSRHEISAMPPGANFMLAYRLLKWVSGGFMLFLGGMLVLSLLHSQTRYFNVLMFLGASLLPQVLLLLILLFGYIFRRKSGSGDTGSLVLNLLRQALFWILTRARAVKSVAATEQAWRRQWQGLKRKDYLLWPLISLSQLLAILYSIGILLGLFLCLLTMDVRFFWESTPGLTAVESLVQLVHYLAAPWGWLVPGQLPTMDDISASRISMQAAEQVFPIANGKSSAAIWVPFLVGSMLFWGILPRLLIYLGSKMKALHSIRNYSFMERPERELWRRLTYLDLSVNNDGPNDDAIVLLWGGLNPETDQLRQAVLHQLRLNPVQILHAGNTLDASSDKHQIQQLAQQLDSMAADTRLVLIMESWALAPRVANEVLDQLGSQLHRQTQVRLLLVGAADNGQAFSEPLPTEVRMWEDLLAARDNPQIQLYPYRN